MQSVDLTYEWNDVALLTDQRAYTFICKTMLQIPEHAITELQEIILLDWENQSQQEHTFDGSMQLQIGYLDQQQQKLRCGLIFLYREIWKMYGKAMPQQDYYTAKEK